MTVAISISLYNKFDDLGVLLDIVRNNWEEDYYISVCSNHPEANEKIEDYNNQIDYFEKGDQINYDPSWRGMRKSANKWYRVYNTIRTACKGALAGEGVDYVYHLHADAWQLSEDSLYSLIDEIEDAQASVAFKSKSSSFKENYPPGTFGDQFLLLDAADANNVNLFERKALDFPPPASTHSILPMTCLVKLGWKKIYHYSNQAEEKQWDGTSILEVRNPARPMLYNPRYDQVHIATEDFRSDLGKSLQAYYLEKYGLTQGRHIETLLNNYQVSKERLFQELDRYLKDLNKELGWYGLSVDSDLFGRDMRKILPFIEKSRVDKLKFIIGSLTSGTALGSFLRFSYSQYKLIYQYICSDTGPEQENENPEQQTLNEYYESLLRYEDFPDEVLGNTSIIQKGKND